MKLFVDLNPIEGKEMNKARVCPIISPSAANYHLHTAIVATNIYSQEHPYKAALQLGWPNRWDLFDQMKAIDKNRIIKRLGVLDASESISVNTLLATMFSEF